MNKLLLLLGVIGIGAGGYFMVKFVNQGQVAGQASDKSNLILAAVFFVVALICFAIFFFKRFRAEADQDISITKF
jgi:flagellar biogenesis protein FliO